MSGNARAPRACWLKTGDTKSWGRQFMATFQPMEYFHGEKGRKKECDCEFKSSVAIWRRDRVWLMVADGLTLGVARLQKHSCVAGSPARVQLECIRKNSGEVAKTDKWRNFFSQLPPNEGACNFLLKREKWEEEKEEWGSFSLKSFLRLPTTHPHSNFLFNTLPQLDGWRTQYRKPRALSSMLFECTTTGLTQHVPTDPCRGQ